MAKEISYEATPVRATKTRTLERTNTLEIIGFILYRHRLGLSMTVAILSVSYIAYEKISYYF